MIFRFRYKSCLIDHAVFAPNLTAPTKAAAVELMVRLILERRGFSHDAIKRVAWAMLSREELGSTGIGWGVAVPHTRHPDVSVIEAGWFSFNPPVDFEALDGEPVSFIACFISPCDKPGDHLRVCEEISRFLKYIPYQTLNHSHLLEQLLEGIRTCGGELELDD